MNNLVTRREILRAGAATGTAAVLANSLISRALAASPRCGSLKDVEHVVILIQENRSFDHYFGSVIGPTDPNRLYSMSAWLDPAGTQGGPILTTSSSRVERFGTLSWTTMPEQLQARGISWKVYGSADGHFGDNVLPYFKQYQNNPVLAANGVGPTYPGGFQSDVAAGTLPQVSWVLAPLVSSEHPPAPEEQGEVVSANVLNTLVSNSALWRKTALFITYDEN